MSGTTFVITAAAIYAACEFAALILLNWAFTSADDPPRFSIVRRIVQALFIVLGLAILFLVVSFRLDVT